MSTDYRLVKALLLLCLLSLAFPRWAMAEKNAAGGEKLSKGEAIMLLSTTDIVKKKVNELFSWTVGYDVARVNRVKLTPIINYVKAVPRKIPPDDRTILMLLASVDDPGGLQNIAGVRADLTPIGKYADTSMVDSGLFGDEKPTDGVYTLQTTVGLKVPLGSKDIPVAVSNKKGWLALAKVNLEVKKNPEVLEARCSPEKVLADGKSLVTINVKIDNPGRLDDVQYVSANLNQLRLPDRLILSATTGSNIWTSQFALPLGLSPGTYVIPVQVTNLLGGLGFGEAVVTVYR